MQCTLQSCVAWLKGKNTNLNILKIRALHYSCIEKLKILKNGARLLWIVNRQFMLIRWCEYNLNKSYSDAWDQFLERFYILC